jgi:ferric-dicitrate binding protein FerR (iron transport regulator)
MHSQVRPSLGGRSLRASSPLAAPLLSIPCRRSAASDRLLVNEAGDADNVGNTLTQWGPRGHMQRRKRAWRRTRLVLDHSDGLQGIALNLRSYKRGRVCLAEELVISFDVLMVSGTF